MKTQCHEDDFYTCEDNQTEEGDEFAYIEGTHTVVDPWAVMVIPPDADAANETVELVEADAVPALWTYW